MGYYRTVISNELNLAHKFVLTNYNIWGKFQFSNHSTTRGRLNCQITKIWKKSTESWKCFHFSSKFYFDKNLVKSGQFPLKKLIHVSFRIQAEGCLRVFWIFKAMKETLSRMYRLKKFLWIVGCLQEKMIRGGWQKTPVATIANTACWSLLPMYDSRDRPTALYRRQSRQARQRFFPFFLFRSAICSSSAAVESPTLEQDTHRHLKVLSRPLLYWNRLQISLILQLVREIRLFGCHLAAFTGADAFNRSLTGTIELWINSLKT